METLGLTVEPLLNLSNEHAPEELEGDELAEGMRSMRLLD